jgi:hypothetical protein
MNAMKNPLQPAIEAGAGRRRPERAISGNRMASNAQFG